jgi:uncharacterized membrane protein
MTATVATGLDAAEKLLEAKRAAVAQKESAAKQQTATQEAVQKMPWWSTHDAMTISASVLVFGALLIASATFAIARGLNATLVLRVYGLLSIIVMAVFLVVAGYDASQMGPVIGLLGTLAGYLVGRTTSAASEVDSTKAPTKKQESS